MEDVTSWLESRGITEKLTTNFYKTLKRFAERNKGDKFRKSCVSLGKFKGQDNHFFDELKQLLLEGAGSTDAPANTGLVAKDSSLNVMKRSRNDEAPDDEEDVQLHTPVLQKDVLLRNSYNNNDATSCSFRPIEEKGEGQVTEEEDGDEEEQEEQEVLSSAISEVSEDEDMQWYNYDDDYGNTVVDEDALFNVQTGNISVTSETPRETINSLVDLTPFSVSTRKNWLPYFLNKYSEQYDLDSSVLLGSFSESSHDGLVNPFKNPEGQFALNARKGSRSVAMKRNQNDSAEKAKESTNLSGTSLGEALGLNKDSNILDNSRKTNKNIDKQTATEDVDKTRKSLPIYKARANVLQMIRDNQVSILIGETGSGKTTQLAQYLYEDGYTRDGGLIACTQPRRVAAMSVAKRVAQEMDKKVGDLVGYSIRFEDKTGPSTKIKFMTDGILLRETLIDENLEKYKVIIIDEAHERSLNTDVLLGLLKNLVKRRRDIKIIITSATLDANKFSQFFGGLPQYKVPGKTYPVQVMHTSGTVPDYVEAAVSQAVRIHLTTAIQSGDILIFMTGQEDILCCIELIKERIVDLYGKKYGINTFDKVDDVELFPIYSALPAEIQNRIFLDLDIGKRKIVVSTNIAETSLTISGIRYVIDCGYSKLKVYNPKIGLDSLAIAPISIANANQRSGRAGRTAPGIAYRLYSEETELTDMYQQTIPEIKRTNLSNIVLTLKSLGIKNVVDFPFLDPPSIETLMASMYELWFLGVLNDDGELNALGKKMVNFPLQPTLSKVLIQSISFGCSKEVVTIVAMLSVPQVFERPKERQKEADEARKRFFISESDHLTLMNVYDQWKSAKYSPKWCKKNFVLYKSLIRAREIRTQIVSLLKQQKHKLKSAGSDLSIIGKCICSGFAQQAAKASGLTKYVHLRTGMELRVHPTSSLYGLPNLPPYVIYHEMLLTEQEYICCVTSVDPLWLADYGSLLYDVQLLKSITNDNLLLDDVSSRDDYDFTEIKKAEAKVSYIVSERMQRIKQIKQVYSDQDAFQVKNQPIKSVISKGNSKSLFKRRRPL